MSPNPSEPTSASLWSRRFLRHFVRLQLGLFIFGLGIAVMLEAQIGLDPWSSFHEGLSLRTGLSFGRVTQLVGALLILFSWLTMRVRPGIGTVSNMLLVGPWVDLLRVQPWVPQDPGGILGVASFCTGMLLVGLALATYIGARLGAGPRDGFILAMAGRLGRSIRLTRISIELVVLACGFALGGPVGLGTVLFAVLMGPIMQFSFHIFRVGHDPSPTWRTADSVAAAQT
jgi:uncharacterized membrane protein YczE